MKEPAPELEEVASFSTCRYPDPNRDSGVGFDNIQEKGEHVYQASSKGHVELKHLQLWNKEAIVPCLIDENGRSNAETLISIMDIVDAPGAGVPAAGEFSVWQGHKNNLVFKVMIEKLDILLIVASSNVQAVTVPKELQEMVWAPWVKRCGEYRDGRSIICFNAAGDLLKKTKEKIESKSKDKHGFNSADIIYGGLIDPLIATGCGDNENIIIQKELGTWPPVLFFENVEEHIAKFREGIAPGSAAENADKLVKILEGENNEDELPLGLKCVLHLAKDWDSKGYKGFFDGEKNMRCFQYWIIKAFCALLDSEDKGHTLLTRLLKDMTILGAIARSHVRERCDAMDQLASDMETFANEFLANENNPETLENLKRTAAFFRDYWEENPYGPRITIGEHCKRLVAICEANQEVTTGELTIFEFMNVITSLTMDVVDGLSIPEKHKEVADILPDQLFILLKLDSFVRELDEKSGGNLYEDDEKLKRLIALLIERLGRVMHFLANLETEDIPDFVNKFLEVDADIAEMMSCLTTSEHMDITNDRQMLSELHCQIKEDFRQLEDLITANSLANPYMLPAGYLLEKQIG